MKKRVRRALATATEFNELEFDPSYLVWRSVDKIYRQYSSHCRQPTIVAVTITHIDRAILRRAAAVQRCPYSHLESGPFQRRDLNEN